MLVALEQVPYAAYHMEFPPQLVGEDHPICHLDDVNAVAALLTWASQLQGCLVHLHTDNATAAAIFQLSRAVDITCQVSLIHSTQAPHTDVSAVHKSEGNEFA